MSIVVIVIGVPETVVTLVLVTVTGGWVIVEISVTIETVMTVWVTGNGTDTVLSMVRSTVTGLGVGNGLGTEMVYGTLSTVVTRLVAVFVI